MVETCLDRWTFEVLAEEIRHPDLGPDWVKTRGEVVQRVYSHDVYHCGQLSQTLGINGLPKIEILG